MTDSEEEILYRQGFRNKNNVQVYDKAYIYGTDYRTFKTDNEYRFDNSYLCYNGMNFEKIINIVTFSYNGKFVSGIFLQVFKITSDALYTTYIKNVTLIDKIVFVACSKKFTCNHHRNDELACNKVAKFI